MLLDGRLNFSEHLKCIFRKTNKTQSFYTCGKGEAETSSHYLLYCSSYLEERLALLNTIKNIDMSSYDKVIRNLLALYFPATLLSTITKALMNLSLMPL